jgi:outer membrane protein assembly factor BamA
VASLRVNALVTSAAVALVLGGGVSVARAEGAGSDAAAPAVAVEESPARSWNPAVLPLVYYAPESSFGIAAQVMFVRAASTGTAEHVRNDSVALAATAALKRQYGAGLIWLKYWGEDRHRLKLELSVSRLPTKFWGLGNDTPETAGDTYTPVLAGGRITYGTRLVEQVFVGVVSLIGYCGVESFAPAGAVADFLTTNRRRGWLVGAGPMVARDTRDDSTFPRAGSYSTASLSVFDGNVLGDYGFSQLEVDHRTFVSLPLASVLALEAYAMVDWGDPPLEFLSQVGGLERLRGYYFGRYRDKAYVMGQAEWRVPLFWRLGAAVFVAAGNVAPTVGELSGDHLKAAGGGGLRLNLAKETPVNIRLDAAAGPGTFGLYLTLGEAF